MISTHVVQSHRVNKPVMNPNYIQIISYHSIAWEILCYRNMMLKSDPCSGEDLFPLLTAELHNILCSVSSLNTSPLNTSQSYLEPVTQRTATETNFQSDKTINSFFSMAQCWDVKCVEVDVNFQLYVILQDLSALQSQFPSTLPTLFYIQSDSWFKSTLIFSKIQKHVYKALRIRLQKILLEIHNIILAGESVMFIPVTLQHQT